MAHLEELLPEFRNGAKIRRTNHPQGEYIQLSDDRRFTLDRKGKLYTIYAEELMADNWEIYNAPEPYWQKIIDNKCPCWFWDYDEVNKIIGFLIGVNENNTLCRFASRTSAGNSYSYACCRPVRRSEITFYEDKKDD